MNNELIELQKTTLENVETQLKEVETFHKMVLQKVQEAQQKYGVLLGQKTLLTNLIEASTKLVEPIPVCYETPVEVNVKP